MYHLIIILFDSCQIYVRESNRKDATRQHECILTVYPNSCGVKDGITMRRFDIQFFNSTLSTDFLVTCSYEYLSCAETNESDRYVSRFFKYCFVAFTGCPFGESPNGTFLGGVHRGRRRTGEGIGKLWNIHEDAVDSGEQPETFSSVLRRY